MPEIFFFVNFSVVDRKTFYETFRYIFNDATFLKEIFTFLSLYWPNSTHEMTLRPLKRLTFITLKIQAKLNVGVTWKHD